MQSKINTFVLASAALAAVALSAIPAIASTSSKITVPFSFTVDGKNLPAGEYSVERDDRSNFVRLQSWMNPTQSFIWIANPSETRTDRVILTFDPQGENHVLESVQYGSLVTPRLTRKSPKSEDMTPQYAPGQ